MDPLVFEFRLVDFDRKLLPVAEDLLASNEILFKTTVREYLNSVFSKAGGEVKVTAYDDFIHVEWTPIEVSKRIDDSLSMVSYLLSQGASGIAESILKTLERHRPDSENVLLHYGMLLSDKGLYGEAIERLKKVTSKYPQNVNGWIALGVAYGRTGKQAEASVVMEKALEIDPDNPHVLQNLGAVLIHSDPQTALAYLKRAAELLPNDQRIAYGYGVCLIKTGNPTAAEREFQRAIDINGFSDISEACREELRGIADRSFKDRSPDIRLDVVHYCQAALELFEKIGPSGVQKVTAEIAILGRGGLDINDTTPKYTLRSVKGTFSGKNLVAYLYVGLKQLAPDADAGIDLSKEYEEALSLRAKNP